MEDNFIIEASEGMLPIKSDVTAASENKEVKKSDESLDSEESAAAEDSEKKASDLAGESESADESEEDSGDESEETEEDQELEKKSAKKKKGGFQRKLEREQREKEYWKELALKAGKDGNEETPKKESKDAVDSSKPNPNDFETNADYIEAMSDYIEKKIRKEIKEESTKSESEKQFNSTLNSYNSKVSEFKKEAKDFDNVVKNFTEEFEGNISPTIHGMIIKHDQGPKLFYELAKDVEEFERINSLDPFEQAYELGKLEHKISQSKQETKTTNKTTNAPAPTKPIQSKSSVVKKDIYSPDLSYAEYEKMMNEREKNRRS